MALPSSARHSPPLGTTALPPMSPRSARACDRVAACLQAPRSGARAVCPLAQHFLLAAFQLGLLTPCPRLDSGRRAMHGTLFHKQRRALKRTAAFFAPALLLSFVGSVTHWHDSDHIFCKVHQQLEHRDAHAGVSAAGNSPKSGIARDFPQTPHSGKRQHERCMWATWLRGASTLTPDTQAALRTPPLAKKQALLGTSRADIGSPIDIELLSPSQSPPLSLA